MTVRTPVYLDHNATTPVDPRVRERLDDVLRNHFGNPSSAHHAFGWAAARLVEEAREQVARLVGATAREIVFTSGATEANVLALRGVAERVAPDGGHLVISALEHEAVLEPAAQLERRGWRVTRVPARPDGVLDPTAVAGAIGDATVLVSVMAAQNEIGTLQPLREIGTACRERGVLLHTDAAQAAGKIPLDVRDLDVHLLSLSGHKLYGPKGVGALYVRRRSPRVSLEPQQPGGGQERGLRGGTLNVPGIVGLGEACRIAREEMTAEAQRLRGLAGRFLAHLRDHLDGWTLNGHPELRLPGQLNLSFHGVRAHRLLGALTVLGVSSSSACSSAESRPSRVLAELGVDDELASASLRLAAGRFTTAAEMDLAAATVVAAVRRLRAEDDPTRGPAADRVE
jgi:cysteine desulfurase